MRKTDRTRPENDPALLQKLALIEQGYLAVVALIALGALYGGLIPSLGHLLPGDWVPITPQIALAALLGAAGLELTRPRHSEKAIRIGVLFGGLLAVFSCAALLEYLFHVPLHIDRLAQMISGSTHPEPMAALSASAFAALSGVILLALGRKGLASHAADFFVSVFCLLVLVLIRGYLFEGLSHTPGAERTSLFTLLALSLLAFVAFMHRAEVGVFSTLLGVGSGSRIARFAAPLVLLVPFLPQAALANAIRSGFFRAEYMSGVVTFCAAGVALTLMLYMAWKINVLEAKVRELALRDEGTGLLNRRGFHLVSWQALRQARRDGLPFSVMFIELDNLDEIHERGGFEAGAELLAEMADVMRGAFRDTDVMGRIDPAQFALAGYFDAKSTAIMRLRLREAVNYRNAIPGRAYSIEFSSRCVNAKDPKKETLEDLLAEAEGAGTEEPPPQPAAPRTKRREDS